MSNKKQRARSKAKTESKDESKPKVKSVPDYTLNAVWEDHEPDLIHGLYGAKGQSLGVSKLIYSGLPTLDRMLAVKRDSSIYGFPLNKIIELFGPEQSGKTTLALYLGVQFILSGGLVYFVDFEHKYDPAWVLKIAQANGLSKEKLELGFRHVDPIHFEAFMCWLLKFMKKIIAVKNNTKLKIIELEKDVVALQKKRDELSKKRGDHTKAIADLIDEDKTIQDAMEPFDKILNTPFLVIVDSIASIYTKNEKEKGEEEDPKVAEIANLFNRVLKHVRYYLGYTDAHILFLNQVRDRIEMNSFLAKRGSKIRTPGGNAVKHFSDARMQIARIGSIKRTRDKIETVIGGIHNIKIVKNQMGPPPFMEAEFSMLYDHGFFSFGSVLEALAAVGKIKIDGSRYTFTWGGKIVSFIKSEADEYALENPEMVKNLNAIYKKYMDGN